ncbi:MAG: peptidase [Clostridiales bacterium]|jgi:putative selenium metabolism hydrolase|nr:peptidase [Clostridiales bacterium]
MANKENDYLIELCRQLIQIPSLSGEEGKLAKRLKEIYIELGFDEVFIDEYGSIITCIRGENPGTKILFDAHIDTVPVTDPSKWKHNPFGAEIEDGKIYGRGTSDMKGALSAMIAATKSFLEKYKKNFNGEIYIAGVVHEECFEGVAARKISQRVNPDIVIIGEASNLNIKCGQRGRAEIVVETFGRSAHSANPEKGVNAAYKMMDLVNEIQKLNCPSHDILGKGIMELTDIKSSPYPGASVVPDYCKATYDRRLLVGETPEEVLKPIQQIISRMEEKDVHFNAKVSFASGTEKCHTGNIIEGERFFPGWLFSKQDDFIQKIWKGIRSIGISAELTEYSFCTNGSHYAGEKRIKTIGFGPSMENLAHIVDEHIEMDQLQLAYKGYQKILEMILR